MEKKDTLSLTLIQSILRWEDKAANRAMFESKINSIKDKTEIVLLPEMFTTGFSMNPKALAENMEGETIAWMKKIAAAKNIIIAGSVIIEEGGKFYNRLVWVQPNGVPGWYDKRHLFAYAGEDREYTPGTRRLIASVKGWKINLMVCYDLRFPVWSAQQGEYPEYDVLIYVANWPDRRSHAWRTLLQARAIENQAFVVGVNRVGKDANGHNYCGDSLVADPLGDLLYHKKDEEDVFTITLEKDQLNAVREKLPFWKDGDQFRIMGED